MKPTTLATRLLQAALVCVLTACHTASTAPAAAPGTALMSPAEARGKLVALLDDTFAAVSPALRFRDGWPRATENDVPVGTANASLDRYVMTKVSAAKYAALLDLVERHWKDRGYTIESGSADAAQPAVTARTPDLSALTLIVGHPGNITIGAAVTPIAAAADPFGPEPSVPTLPNGNPDILPTVDDPFWSH
ncbi:hypothetical protein [Kitasatospora kifunensis]|uniref:Lipoprotein n=1 Tax=Kitasatospora kifunensis TaxID=58351 RepID=A0A7W7VVP8_KITKI|nr:hypothetical protein [Kitasatospora kifunensis]MBB4923924.1 hypothetical protein [Kitasatospora kifunensis]